MELWEKYNRPLIPLLHGTGQSGQPVRVLDPIQWERTEKDDTLEYTAKIFLDMEEADGRLFLRFQKAGCLAWVYEDGELLWSLGKESIWGRN
ncbi:MAG TPA: hypothetical protein IAA21_13550 [Candidatus Blautia faecigallinarum]|uniref:Uncharacterized protein n=1 Tax=Candidatus Blautia faecigallinarum TaxID=2838488 RepID=A0A9D2IUK0_9FIRM|nr:hypothetical protein [Candidatus Blautia faecigallinarum]